MLLGLSSRVMNTLLNVQSITGYCERNRGKEFPPENFLNNRLYSPYYILKVLAQTNTSLPE
jgi:hypothetical protein